MKRRKRWWLIALVVVLIAAAGATAGVLWFGRSKAPAVRYLTSAAATGTISRTVQADFTLATAKDQMTIVLGGGGSTTSSSSTTSSTTGSASTTYSALTTVNATSPTPSPTASGTPTPSPTPSRSGTPTPSPTPSRSGTPTPSPMPSGSGTPAPTPTSSGSRSSGSGSSTSSGSGSSTTSTSVSGVVTRIALPAGATPRTLQALLKVSGKPIFAFVSSTPLYKTLSVDLSSGTQVANITVLQRALKDRGYYAGSISGTFNAKTQTALKAWQADHGVSQTGKVSTSQFVWVPQGAVLSAWQVDVGSQVSGQAALATVGFPQELVAQALITQADIASLKVGQKAQLTIDGYTGDAFTGTISHIDDQPASATSSAGSSSSTQYSITLRPKGMPKLARSGMTGTLEVVIAQRKNVLLVPTSAVSGTSSVPYVRVMMNGKAAFRQVQTGMATSASTQITGGLTAGEVVITGQYSNAASSTTTSGSGGFGLPGLGGGPVRSSGGSSQGGFQPPAGGGQ